MTQRTRAGRAGLVAQAMARPIFDTFQDFLSDYILVQAGNMCVCRNSCSRVSLFEVGPISQPLEVCDHTQACPIKL